MKEIKAIKIRSLIIGQGLPKICVPLMGKDLSHLLYAARDTLKNTHGAADLYEWRVDSFADAADEKKVIEALRELRATIDDYPLVFTFRSKHEGGDQTLSNREYVRLNEAVIESGLADIIDVELSKGAEIISRLIEAAHENGAFVLLSNHHFEETPTKLQILSILREMQELGADISKVAVMANSPEDLLLLLDTTLTMKEKYGDRPFVTVAMGENGILSRVAGGLFGSAMTFAEGIEPSAPGQLPASQVRDIIELLHHQGSTLSKE